MSLHGVAPEILFQAENDRKFVAAAITRTWVIRDANTEVTIWENFGFQVGSLSPSSPDKGSVFNTLSKWVAFKVLFINGLWRVPFLQRKAPVDWTGANMPSSVTNHRFCYVSVAGLSSLLLEQRVS
jgi:hypothetical protein